MSATIEECVLGIDIGTSSTKGVLARLDGSVIAQAQRLHTLSLPRPGRAEHDADRDWWQDFVSICKELVPRSGGALRAICVSGIGPCLLPCAADLTPLRPAILYGIDTRATAEIDELEALLGEDSIIARGGSALSSQALGPKLLWLRRHESDVWQSMKRWYMASSYVVARLTGEYVLDHHSASQCDPMYDLESGTWAADWVALIAPGVSLPRLVWPGEIVGTVTADAASITGLPPGLPVAGGTVDAWAEAFSVGVRRPGDLMIMYGSTMFFVRVVDKATPQRLLWSTVGIEPSTRSLAAGMSTSGVLTEWVRALAGEPSWEELLSDAATVPPGSRGLLLLPYFAGERTPIFDPMARGVAAGLTLSHGRGELLHAAYEGTALGTRHILQLMETTAGPPRRVVAVGGGSRSELWLQTVSDIAATTQEVPELTIGASYGDALLAAIAVELVPPETDWSSIERLVEPNLSHRPLYDELFGLYVDLYDQTRDVVHALARIGARSQ